MTSLLLVGLGGALGAMSRYGIGLLPFKGTFPLPTLAINLLGAVLIGFVAGLADRGLMASRATLFWKTGVCGGFTTFSTFSLESWKLLHEKHYMLGGAYMLLSVALCLVGIVLGQRLSQLISRP